MKQTRILMGMPISLEIVDKNVTEQIFDTVYDYFTYVDNTYSTYKSDSEISKINAGLPKDKWSQEMKDVLTMCAQTKQQTNGYFDINRHGKLDPSGLVKGWAIKNAADIISAAGFGNYYVDAGGDIQVSGTSAHGKAWRVGIRNPFDRNEVIKTVLVTNEGVATSGTAIRGEHVYNPKASFAPANKIVSITIIGPNIYDADRFATAAFAMGKRGINFIEKLPRYEAYAVEHNKIAVMTSGFERYVL